MLHEKFRMTCEANDGVVGGIIIPRSEWLRPATQLLLLPLDKRSCAISDEKYKPKTIYDQTTVLGFGGVIDANFRPGRSPTFFWRGGGRKIACVKTFFLSRPRGLQLLSSLVLCIYGYDAVVFPYKKGRFIREK